MARTLNEILNEINAKATNYPELEEMEQNDSVVQVWRAVKQVMALGIVQVDQSIDALKKELDDKINTDEHGGVAWYRKQILAYQHGHALAIVNNRPGYLTLNKDVQIVKHVSVTEPSNGGLEIKVAGNDGRNIVPLTTDQKAGLTAYLTRVKFAGTTFTVASSQPNPVSYEITVEIDRAILNNSQAKKAITKTIQHFHKSLDFNGTLYLSKVTDAIQKIEGIIDVQIKEAEISIDSTDIEFDRKYKPPAGYVELDDLEITISS